MKTELKKLYQLALTRDDLVTEKLYEVGYSKPILSRLIKEGVLTRTSLGHYQINGENPLQAQSKKATIEQISTSLKGTDEFMVMSPMSEEEANHFYEQAILSDEITPFWIATGSLKKLAVQCYHQKDPQRLKAKLKEANLQYQQFHYQNYIVLMKDILCSLKKPSSFLYAGIGLAYLKLEIMSNALIYLNIAQLLSNQNQDGLDYTSLLFVLKEVPKTDPFFLDMELANQTKNPFPSPNIKNLAMVEELIINQKADLNSTCQQFGIEKDALLSAKFYLAKQYFANGYFKQGDKIAQELFEIKQNIDLDVLSDQMAKHFNQKWDELMMARAFYLPKNLVRKSKNLIPTF